jgi:hypothetical protein
MDALVGAALSEYLAMHEPDIDLVQRTDLERELCSAIAAMIGVLLDGDDRWPPGYWVDDIDMCAIERDGPASVTFVGVAVTGDDLRHQWIEPVSAAVALTTPGSELASYQVLVGDAALGLSTVPYGERRPKVWPDVPGWIFTFRRP